MKRCRLFASALLLGFGAITVSATTSLTVTAFPLWTDAHLVLHAGDVVSISASGSWSFGLGASTADGQSWWAETTDRFLLSAYQGRLIAYVGADPFQGHWGDASFFPRTTDYWNIGSDGQFASDRLGELWLGINDDAVSKNTADNSGSVFAQIAVTPVPEPGSPLLVLLGLSPWLLGRFTGRRGKPGR